jgi:hypothetical protein
MFHMSTEQTEQQTLVVVQAVVLAVETAELAVLVLLFFGTQTLTPSQHQPLVPRP